MPSLKETRAEETKKAILDAAGRLFGEKGYESVTMRQIARGAGCSHTTIYLYFKDKADLLHQLAAPPLEELRAEMEAAMAAGTGVRPGERLRKLSRLFIEFCLRHRGMYPIFFGAGAGRVDIAEPELEINRLRNGLFNLMKQALGEELGLSDGDRLLACSRIFFYLIHGIAATYNQSSESSGELMERLSSTFDTAVDAMLAGLKAQLSEKEAQRP
ncbi:TetR/AcrR family transcriptional regulator [Paenibacillus thermoaerophilus]|uniref:TetR/AcrR family transcriptional regulator n=1 Tax=Paenibacillus thermoaerophilus TaxID=1215385 RepID=A0ABW2V1X3_9BACL|nr:TetR/AcrR family transcriptional regulator [Paenibacillus thermoaerophilus]TMV13913.1 TetR/AcrR family transcriptional regulator [Paenibacillus thermoaerophilus]